MDEKFDDAFGALLSFMATQGRPDCIVIHPDRYHWLMSEAYKPINWNLVVRREKKEKRRIRMRRKKRRGYA